MIFFCVYILFKVRESRNFLAQCQNWLKKKTTHTNTHSFGYRERARECQSRVVWYTIFRLQGDFPIESRCVWCVFLWHRHDGCSFESRLPFADVCTRARSHIYYRLSSLRKCVSIYSDRYMWWILQCRLESFWMLCVCVCVQIGLATHYVVYLIYDFICICFDLYLKVSCSQLITFDK